MASPATSEHKALLLNAEQKSRLYQVCGPIVLHTKFLPANNSINETLLDLLKMFLKKYSAYGNQIKKVFLVGGAASNVANPIYAYSDIDIVMTIELESEDDEDKVFNDISLSVDDLLVQLMRKHLPRCYQDLFYRKGFLSKRFRFQSKFHDPDSFDSWSIFSLNNFMGRNVELKFVRRLDREYEFASDSLKIELTSLINNTEEPLSMISAFGDVQRVLYCIENRIIDTKNPENITGGGFLKYVKLSIQGYRYYGSNEETQELLKEMIKSFFAGWVDMLDNPIKNYIENHFGQQDNFFKKTFVDRVANCRDLGYVGSGTDRTKLEKAVEELEKLYG